MPPPTRVITQEAALAERPRRALRRRLAALAFLDVVGYSRLMAGDDELTLSEWAALQDEVITPRTRTWRGRMISAAGDGLLLEFTSALNAFRWAVDVQAAIASRSFHAVPLQVRVALHLGDVIDGAEGDVQGDGVNTAARLQAHAEPGGIVVSQAIANEVAGKATVEFRDLGLLALNNIPRPVHAFRIVAGPAGWLGQPQPGNTTRRWPLLPHPRAPRHWSAGGLGAALVVLLATLAVALPLQERLADKHVPPLDPRAAAIQLYDAGRAVACTQHPCPQQWLAARDLFEQAIARDPTFAPPYAYAALTYTNFIANNLSLDEERDLRAAEHLAVQATALAPGDAMSHRARGAVLALQPGRLQDALAADMRSLAIDPNQAPVRASTGWVLLLLGRPAEAETFLTQALAAAPDHLYAPAWHTYLGLAELFQDRDGHGAAQFRQAIAQQSPDAANGDIALQRSIDLAAALALNGALDEARDLGARLRQQNPVLSTQSVWNCDCSRTAGYQAGMAILKRGVLLAGIPDDS